MVPPNYCRRKYVFDPIIAWNVVFHFLIQLFAHILFVGQKAADFYDDVDIIIRELVHRLNDDSSVVLKANNAAIDALTKCVPVEELVKHIRFIKDLIGSMVSDARYRKGGVGDGEFFLPGLNIPKGK